MPTVVTRTIGVGKDYANFTTAEADVVNIATSAIGGADLVANDGAIVFEADAGTYSESPFFNSSLTTDATRQVTYKPAAGSEHGGDPSSGVIVEGQININNTEQFMLFDGLVITQPTGVNAPCVELGGDGNTLRSCVIKQLGNRGAVRIGVVRTAGQASPVVIENCVLDSTESFSRSCIEIAGRTGGTFTHIVNCTGKAHINKPFIESSNFGVTTKILNCLSLGVRAYTESAPATLTGSNNFGGSTNPFPVAIQGSPATITASTAYDPGAGDYALYVGKNCALLDSPNNDVIDGGVGPSVNSDVPTTDILGNPRSGATANPGAFEVPQATTVITKTIGPSGRDYSTFTLAEADVTNIGTSADLLNENEAIVFEADAGTYSENVVFQSTLTTDATRNVTYKAATGSEHGGSKSVGVIIEGTGSTYSIDVRDNYVAFDGLVMGQQSGSYVVHTTGSTGFSLNSCIIDGETVTRGPTFFRDTGGSTSERAVISNCVVFGHPTVAGHYFYTRTVSQDAYIRIVNSTAIGDNLGAGFRLEGRTGYVLDVEITNCLALNPRAYLGSGDHTITGSNNFGGSTLTQPFPVAIQGSPYPISVTTSFSTPLGSGDYAVYMGATGALANVTGNDVWQQGVGPGSNSDVPTTDINGVARSGATCNPGAFEADGFVAPTIATRTIGSGRDYSTFTLAEADTTNIATSAFGGDDLTFYNGAIVFEADASAFTTGSTLFISNPSITVDATRNISYTAASGRPVYTYTGTGDGVSIYDPYTRWSGIDVVGSSANKAMQVRANSGYGANQAGTIIENATITAGTTAVSCEKHATNHALGTSSEPITLRNLVTKSNVAVSQYIAGTGHTTGAHCLVVNCTHLGGSSANQVWNWALTGGMPDASFKIINCANLAQNASNDANITGGGVVLTGSRNNIGNAAATNSSFRFENIGGGIGTQYTPTTSYSQALESGDYAVFMGATGALADVSGNDVWQQGVGPSVNSDVPTTDILGNTRSGNTANPGAFELDGYVAPTTVTRTIGSGRDYANFTAAEADIPNISTSAFGDPHLTVGNGAIVFEADAGTYSESVTFQSALTTDATRNVTYKPAAGSEHGGVPGEGVYISDRVYVRDSFTIIDGISGGGRILAQGCDGAIIRNGIWNYFDTQNSGAGTAAYPLIIENCVFWFPTASAAVLIRNSSGRPTGYYRVINCTAVVDNTAYGYWVLSAYTTLEVEFVNCITLGLKAFFDSTSGAAVITGSNNFGGATSPFPAALQGSPYPVTASKSYDPGSGDFALYVGSTGELLDSPNNDVVNQGVGPASNSDVPTTDIKGNTRSGATANPGAFELLNTTKTVTRTIGVGQNYETFRDAVDDLENIATSAIGGTNILDYNGAIVFNIVSGQYTDSTDLYIDTSLVSDRTRNVTFKAADGHEHGGKLNAGVIYSNTGGTYAFRIVDSHVVLQDIHIKQNLSTNKRGIEIFSGSLNEAREGGHINRVIVTIQGKAAGVQLNRTGWGTKTDPLLITNCYFMNGTLNIFAQNTNSAKSDNHVKIINCTSNSRGGNNGYMVYPFVGSGQTLNLTMTNNVVLPNFSQSDGFNMDNGDSTGTLNWYGTNNYAVGYSMDADETFPVAQRGSIYPITPIRNTYNTLSASGDEVVVSFGNGQLVNVPGNAIWNQGIGPDSDSDVPTVDIGGNPRTGTTTNPGAYNTDLVIPSTKTVVEKYVDAGGDGQYTTPALAEADMRNIMVSTTGSNDMFEANAQLDISIGGGDYSPFDFGYDRESQANLYSGPENLITFSALNLNDRPRFFGTNIGIRGDFLVVEGFDLDGGVSDSAIKFFTGGTGVKISKSTLKSASVVAYVAVNGDRATAEHPVVFENCEFKSTGTNRTECIYGGGTGQDYDHYYKIINCQANPDDCTEQLSDSFIRLTGAHNGYIIAYNNLNLRNGSNDIELGTLRAGGDFFLSGSNNVGSVDNLFLRRFNTYGLGNIQASATTSLSPPVTGSYSIYEASSNKLVDSTRNDAWKQGEGPSINPEVDVFDIEGRTRAVYDGLTLSGYDRVNPGAYEVDTDFWTPPIAFATGPTDGPGAVGDQSPAGEAEVYYVNNESLDVSWDASAQPSRSDKYSTRERDVRAKIFKMTQAKSNISFIYRESLRAMISAFNDIGHYNAQDEFIDIKCIHGNAERAIAKLNQENNIVLPMLSISQTISNNDDERRRYESVLVHEKYWDEKNGRAVRILSLAPRPVNVNYQLNIWCKYMADMDQILEQVRLKFNPEMNVPTEYSTLAKAFLESEDMVGSMTAITKEDRILKKTLNIVLRTYIPSPKFLITSTGEIEEFKIITDGSSK